MNIYIDYNNYILYLKDKDNIIDICTKLKNNNIYNYEILSNYSLPNIQYNIRKNKNNIGVYVFISGIIGFIIAISFQYWAQTSYYLINTSGKPFFSVLPSIPVAFEIAVLFAFLGGFVAFIIKSKLLNWINLPSFESPDHLIIIIFPIDNVTKSILDCLIDGK